MADLNPFLGERYHELVTMSGSAAFPNEQAANDSAVEEADNNQADRDAAHYQSSSEADLGLADKDVTHNAAANYKAALTHYSVKSTRGVRSPNPGLPVFDPESLKDHAQSGLNNKPSTSELEEEHLREVASSLHDSDSRADGPPPNDSTFMLCFVAPKSISDCIAIVKYEGCNSNGLLEDAEVVKMHLEPTLDAFGFAYNFWCSDNLPRREERNTELAYHFTLTDTHGTPANVVSSTLTSLINNLSGAKPESERVVIWPIRGLRKCLSFRFDVVTERGEVLSSDALGVTQWLAVMTQMIVVANPANVIECVREFLRVRHAHSPKLREFRGYVYSYGKPLLGTVANWAAKVADAYGGSRKPDVGDLHKRAIGVKMFLLCLTLFDLLKELVRYEEGQPEKLYEAYAIVLSSLRKFAVSGIYDYYNPPPVAKRVIHEGLSELVSRVSRFSYDWIALLDVLGRYDSSFACLDKVAEFQLDMRDGPAQRNAEHAYRSAVASMLDAHEGVRTAKAVRKRTFRKALLAAPTFPTFLIASRELQPWMRGAGDWDPTESPEDEIRAELQDGLHGWFTRVMPQDHANSYPRRNSYHNLQQHLELIVAHVVQWDSGSAAIEDDNPGVALPGFLTASFREHIVEMLLQTFMSSSKPTSDFRKLSDWSTTDAATSLVDTTKKIVFNYPFTFTLPLLPAECRLLIKFASSDVEEYISLSKLVIQKVGCCIADATPTPEDVEHLTKDVVRPWLTACVGRGKHPQSSASPLSYFRCVQEIFNLGVDPSGVFGRCLTQAAMASSQQRSRGLQHFLAESEKISQLHESLQVQYKSAVVTMIHWQLQSATNVAELDRTSEQILRRLLCAAYQGLHHASAPLIAKEKSQVELCVALLDKMGENAVFVESLTPKRAFQTISTSNFASCLLQIQTPPPAIQEHPIYLKVQEACHAFSTLVLQGEVTMGTIDSVSRTGNNKWGSILNSLGYKAASVALDDAFNELVLYKKRLQACDILATLCGYLSAKGCPIQGMQRWAAEMADRKENWMSTPLGMIAYSHWPPDAKPSLFEHLDSLVLLHESEIFRCILVELCRRLFERLKAEGKVLPLLVDVDDDSASSSSADATPDAWFAMVAGELVPRAVHRYRAEMEPYCGKKNLEKMNMDKLYALWVTVDAARIETEFDLARRELKTKDATTSKSASSTWFFWGKAVDMIELIQAWKAIKAKGELVAALPKVARLFRFDESCEGYLGKMKSLMGECDENCSLKEFTDLHRKEGKSLLGKVSVNEEFAFVQLAKSEPLISFLRDKLDEDFRNLIDAVEEGSDNDFVQESILSDLIDLHRMFRPVLKSRSPTFEQLRKVMLTELKTSAASESACASTLAAKLFMCNENVAQITRFLSSVANRGLKMKDHMKRILRGGKYHFSLTDAMTVCDLKLTCGDTGIRYVQPIFESEVSWREETCVYNLAELQDLRSRARLVLSTHKAQAKRFLTDQADSSAAETEKDTGLFIEQVDVVERLVTSISELCASGHFRFAQFDRSLSGLQELQALASSVDQELREWYAAVKQARSTNYCLNYFRSMELRLLLEVLSDGTRPSRAKEDMCVELLQWAGVTDPRLALQQAKHKAQLQMSMGSHSVTLSLSESLQLTATSLESLFQKPVFVFSSASSSTSSALMKSRSMSKHNEALVLALVEESHMEHEAVVSLFHKRGLSLRDVPRNVLLCSSFTTWEEIHLLLLRCFQRTEQSDVGLFCIAYVEKLSFECQAQFLVVLQEMVHEWEEERRGRSSNHGEDCEQLAVVCCAKSQALLAVSHHLNVRVLHVGILNPVDVRLQLPAECSHIRVVTSELPGMGKTRKVFSTAPELVRPLCVSGNTSRNALVSQLKELDLRAECVLHLDISSVVNPETFNVLLFELLVLGCLKSDIAGVFHLNTSNVHIELGNTLGNELAHSLPVCDWFQRKHLTWNLESLEVDNDPNSDTQVVCVYLQALELRQLDNRDLIFTGASRNVQPLPAGICRGLLKRNFINHVKEGSVMSFTVLEMFVKFFACQLRSLTDSVFFKVEMLQFMRATINIRSYLVVSLLEVSRDLSLRSVKPWLHEQQQARGKSITDLTMRTRFEGMLRWSDSNHLMIFFQSEGPILFLYRNVNLLPDSISQLVNSQRLRTEAKQMPDYATMTSQELWSHLWPILQKRAPGFEPNYVLTADNFLKMALIALRVAARVPVLIMGETGCGKTSLLRVLAKYCGVEFYSITLHAGTTVEDIRSFVNQANDAAIAGTTKVWAFLDEINACDHLGFLNGVICHHLLDGKRLNPNLVILAACNPYRIHDSENSQTGFSPRELMNPGDVKNYNLAYRVHPLPEAMLDYVWDFGLLSRHDEQAYIEAMAKDNLGSMESVPHVQLFADLLVQSQAFVRECHGEASVSLRDASRCISLYAFFLRDVPKRSLQRRGGAFRKDRVRATLLAFAHCYHSRLATERQRRNYRLIFADVLKAHEPSYYREFTGDTFAELLRAEQLDLLNRMDVPVGIAKNKAILENVFVTLVCMLNHIPVFVIGKPGSGKTLALQLIYGNLRGSESRDNYFQKLPQMYRFSYQGSESSTSEGILKVFEKAQRCRKDNEGRDVLVVVVLDEVGLAEVSRHNPLKVLHALLEPEEPQQVAVVGISNWSLDAAKMNRAIHLSQPDPSEQDLYDTSIAILESFDSSSSTTNAADQQGIHQTLRKELKGLAKSYHRYHSQQTKPNFHGLRDFYSLIKSLQVTKSTVISWQLDGLVAAVWRNFGGSPEDVPMFSHILKQNLGHEELLLQPPPVMDLVRENLEDKHARHLMLITTGDSAIGILEKFQKNVIIIHGSKLKDDCSDDYSYLLLSIIILHMEAGRCILLRGVERLWSSLYDMLNQHYTTVAERRNCRIAIGAYSNPMCFVHDSFRCIVVVDFSQVSRLDPPFLNRFEKQVLTYETILTGRRREAVVTLKSWCEQMADLPTNNNSEPSDDTVFEVNDLFAGFHEDTLPSLVLHHQPGNSEDISTTESSEFALLLDRCKEDLLRTAHVDAMVRASLSARCRENVSDLEKWAGLFFGEWQEQQGLKEFLATAIQDESLRGNGRGLRVVITTRTIIHMPIRKFLFEIDAQIEKLGDFSSERQFQTQIQLFLTGNSSLLILQADAIMDKEHIQHAKFLVDKNCADYHAQVSPQPSQVKNIVLIIHTHREMVSLTGFTFLSGWQQITLDQLQKEETDLRVFLDHSVADLVKAETIPLKDIMVKVLTWSFLCIKYPKALNPAAYCQQMVQKICESKELWGCFKSRALVWLVEDADPLWQASVASDRRLLSLSSSLQDAFLLYIEEKLRQPVARLVYLLEKSSDLGSYFKMDAVKREAWRAAASNAELVNISSIPVPRHPEGYQVKCPLSLSLPFVAIYSHHVDKGFRDLYLTQLSKTTPSSSSGHGCNVFKIGHDIVATMRNQLPEFAVCIDTNPELYVGDFAKMYAPYKCDNRSEVEAQAFEWVLRGNLGEGSVTLPELHILLWEHGEKLQAQALLVASCLTESSVGEQLAQLKSKRLPDNEFDAYLVAQCYVAVLPPSEMIRDDFLQRVGIDAWIRNLELLIDLASPLEAFGGPTRWAILTSLEVLQDLAHMVRPPFGLQEGVLQGLVKWLGGHGTDFTPGELLEAVLRLAPDNLQTEPRLLEAQWLRFLASFFRKVLKGKTTMSDVNAIAAFIFKLRNVASVMKSLIGCVLDASLSHTLAYFVDVRCPKYTQFLLQGESGLQVGETSFVGEEGTHAAFVLLSDVIYESLDPAATASLLRGEDVGTEWTSQDFLRCVAKALELIDAADSPLTVQVTAAFAFLRAVLDAVASELERILSNNSNACSSPPAVAMIARTMRSESASPTRFAALRLYLLKVLHMKRGLSLVEISYLATRCGEIRGLGDYTTILQWEGMHDVTNPLGFDPFWSSSALYTRAGEAINYMASNQESRGGKIIERHADLASQQQITAAIASKLYLPGAARALTPGERAASTWLLNRPKCLQKWDPKWRAVVPCFAQNDRVITMWSDLRLSPNMPTHDLWFRSLAAHILLVVTGLPRTSPLQGYVTLDREHLEVAFVLGAPNSSLAAFRTVIANGQEIGEYKCPCGYEYFVGECRRPVQSTTCPGCGQTIGGTHHVPITGNVLLQPQQMQTGYIVDSVSRSDTFYSVRNLDHKCYRALRLILHFCLLIGLHRASTTEALARWLGLIPQSRPSPLEELRTLVEEDFAKLDLLLACNRETTIQYLHYVVTFLSGIGCGMQHNTGPLITPAARALWETEFQRIFDNEIFDNGAHRAAGDYLEKQKGSNRYAELVEERGQRVFAPALEDVLRITALPSVANFRTLYKQDAGMIAEHPLIQVFFDHEKHLEQLKHFMHLLAFCNTAHEDFSFRISRPDAASMSMRDALQQSSGMRRQFRQFADSWNAIREKVVGYECKAFSVPVMNEDARLAMCLVEPRDHGLHIVALFEYLRNFQNGFLNDVAPAVDARARQEQSPHRRAVHVQACKAEDIVRYDKQWLEDVVKEVAMADLRSGRGQRVLYDSVIIQEHLFRALVAGKAHLDADWEEFPYKHEAFHRHATILADVATAIPQEVLRPETLQAVQREMESGGVGAGQFLEMMNLCLGFLRRTGGHQQQALGAYCELWLGKDAAELISKSTVFDKICLKHIVSLYEGLEDSASGSIGMLVSQKYKTPLTLALAEEVLGAVKTENAWKEEADVERIPASVFLSVLRRFMFRYLSVDNHPKDVQLHLYLADSRLVTWPADVVSEDVVDNCFPSTLLLQHSFATYMLLAEICKGGDWEKAGQSNGWITHT